ncbi:type II toxin-antitoxin system RelE/ParE family toxin [Candidatus Parcubacteria bacterium]|nr:MAG: type II toxin-antitoxin system RelE/ParE family toxin [Candidatus Parcubacteria bacterium]
MSDMFQVLLFESPSGRSPVKDFIEAQSQRDQARILAELDDLMEFGPFPRGNKIRHVRNKLWELRFPGERGAFRFFFCVASGNRVVIVHAICKKSRKTPKQDLELALRRAKQWVT